jgi:beta-glucosidase
LIQASGAAIADVLTGTVNPSGRLAETIPHRLEDNSSYLNFPGDSQVVRYGEGLFIGYRGYDKTRQDVAFPFSFGLSYTSFALSDLDVITRGAVADDTFGATVTVTVANTGSMDGAEVVQVYVEDVDSSVARPVRELKGFTKVSLAPGSSQTVSIELDQRAFSFWSVEHGRWAVEAGDFVVGVGPHSRYLPLSETITVDAPRLALPLGRDSTLQEWMADPTGRQLIEQEVADGQPAVVLEEELLAVIGTMPMSTLANFGGMSLDHDALDRIAHQWQQQARVPRTRLEAPSHERLRCRHRQHGGAGRPRGRRQGGGPAERPAGGGEPHRDPPRHLRHHPRSCSTRSSYPTGPPASMRSSK